MLFAKLQPVLVVFLLSLDDGFGRCQNSYEAELGDTKTLWVYFYTQKKEYICLDYPEINR